MTFFYNLNKTLDGIRKKPELKHSQLNERDMSRADEGIYQGGPDKSQIPAVQRKNNPLTLQDLEKERTQSPTSAEGMRALQDRLRDINPLDGKMSEAAKYRDPKYKDKLYTQEPPDYTYGPDMDDAYYNPKPDDYEGRKRKIGGGEFSHNDPLRKGQGIGRSGIKNNILDRGPRKGLPSRDQITSLKGSIKDAHGTHAQPNLPEAAGSIDFDKVLDAIAALYGDDMWENDAMQDLANDLAQAGPTDPELDFIIAKGRLPKRLANTQFSAGDNVQFGEAGAPMTSKQKSFAALADPKDKITFADKIAGAKKEVDEMLGDVAAEAMKSALSGGQKKLDKNDNGRLDANDFAMLRRGGKKVADESKDDDNNPFTSWKKPRAEKPKVGSVERGALHDIEHTATGRKVTRRVDPNTGHSVGTDDDSEKSAEKRGRGRPAGKGAGKSIGAKGPSGKSKLMTREGEVSTGNLQQMWRLVTGLKTFVQDPDGQAMLKELIGMVKHYMNQGGNQELDEKATSKKQQKFMGMVHSAQKGEKPASKEVAKVAKTMKKGDAEDFASTKHKGLPEKKAKKEEVEETTTSGSVATAPADSGKKAKGGMQFGKGVYESLDKRFRQLLNEEMTINVNMGPDGQKSISVTATEADADQLAQLLNLAGMQGNDNSSCPTCGQAPCGCAGQVDENSPDWPTDQETIDNNDEHLRKFSGGLNGPKSTGQATVPVLASQLNRQRTMEDTVQLERNLFDLYKNYKTK